jgi:hypothetical protein
VTFEEQLLSAFVASRKRVSIFTSYSKFLQRIFVVKDWICLSVWPSPCGYYADEWIHRMLCLVKYVLYSSELNWLPWSVRIRLGFLLVSSIILSMRLITFFVVGFFIECSDHVYLLSLSTAIIA